MGDVIRSALRMLWIFPAVLLLVLPGALRAEVRVVATSKPIHALVSSVMAGIGTPELLVGGQTSPHSYSMKPSDAQKVHNADVFFRVSEQLEPFTRKLVQSLPGSVRVVSLIDAPGLTLLEMRRGGVFDGHEAHGPEIDEEPGLEHGHEGPHDPHIWLDPENAKAMVEYIAEVLATIAPDQATTFATNAQAELRRLTDLSEELARELAPVVGKPFVVYHDAFQYFENRFGLAAVGSVTVNPDLPPSGKRLQELRSLIRSAGARCVFAEPYLPSRAIEVIAEGTGAKTGILDPEGLTLQPGPQLYAELMRNLSRSFRACLLSSP